MKKLQFIVEKTDTFCGEANYCFVHREVCEIALPASTRKIVQTAKKSVNLSGVRCKKRWDTNEELRYDVIGTAICFFISDFTEIDV